MQINILHGVIIFLSGVLAPCFQQGGKLLLLSSPCVIRGEPSALVRRDLPHGDSGNLGCRTFTDRWSFQSLKSSIPNEQGGSGDVSIITDKHYSKNKFISVCIHNWVWFVYAWWLALRICACIGGFYTLISCKIYLTPMNVCLNHRNQCTIPIKTVENSGLKYFNPIWPCNCSPLRIQNFCFFQHKKSLVKSNGIYVNSEVKYW